MIEQPRSAGHAKPGEDVDHVLAEAREALADARDVLLAERQARGDLREAAADRRDRAADTRAQSADERDLALQARQDVADERDRVADARSHAVAQRHAADQQLGAELERRTELLRELIDAADARDRAAEVRDRAAEAREAAAAVRGQRYGHDLLLDEQSRAAASIDRIWAGNDRDAAAADRAAQRDMTLRDPGEDE